MQNTIDKQAIVAALEEMTGGESRAFKAGDGTPGAPGPNILQAFSGGPSSAGVTVNEHTALTFSAVYTAVRILAETLAMLPLETFRKIAGGGKDKYVDHPAYEVLRHETNENMTAYKFREVMTGHLVTWGNCYAEIVRTNGGQLLGLYPIAPNRVTPYFDKSKRLKYEVRQNAGFQPAILDKDEMFHVAGLGFDGIVGYSPIKMHMNAVGVGLAAETFGAKLFGNGAKPGGILQHKGKLSPEAAQRLKEQWNANNQGSENSNRTIVLEEDFEWKAIGIPPDEAQFLETRKFQIIEVARIYRIPPHMMGDLERASFSNIEFQGLDFYKGAMLPYLVNWEQEIRRKLFKGERDVFAEFSVDSLLRGDMAARYTAYKIAKENGWLNSDEIRDQENLNPLPDGQGKVYMVPLNMTTPQAMLAQADAMIKEAKNPTPKDGRESAIPKAPSSTTGPGGSSGRSAPDIGELRSRFIGAFRDTLADVAGRIVRKEVAAMRKAAKKPNPEAAVREFYSDHAKYVAETIAPSMRSLSDAMAGFGEAVQFDATAYAQTHVDASLEALKSFDPDAIDVIVTRWESERPKMIAETLTGAYDHA